MRRMRPISILLVLGVMLMVPVHSTAQQQPDDVIDKVMKRVGPAFGGLRKALDGGSADQAAQQATALRQAFADTEAFFKSRSKSDGVQWAQDGIKATETLQKDLTAKNLDAAKADAGAIGKSCQSCHAVYRDKAQDGSYRMKPGN